MIITIEQKFHVNFIPRTAAGNTTRVDGIPMWEMSNPDVAELKVAEDGMSADIFASMVGMSMLVVTCDADLDTDEIRELKGILDISVVEAEAETVILEAGRAEQK